jgi:hypothetical protein
VRIRAELFSGILFTCKVPPMPPGMYHAEITTNLVDTYDFGGDYISLLRPVVTKALPGNAGVAGGTLVTVSGVFMPDGLAMSCDFGVERVSGSIVSSESMICLSPAHAAGDILLAVCVDNTTCSESVVKFTFKDLATTVAVGPKQGVIASVHPSVADSAGGALVSIMTSELDLRTRIYCHFGDIAVAAIRESVNMSICISPEHDPGISTLSIRSSADILSPTTLFTQRFIFAAAPTLYSVEPSMGPLTGGTIVTAMGKFIELPESSLSCMFDTIPVGAISVSNTSIACILPAVETESQEYSKGYSMEYSRIAVFTVRDSFGRSSSQTLQFEYGASSSVQGVSPSVGWSDTSQIISVQGQNFVPTTGTICVGFVICATVAA